MSTLHVPRVGAMVRRAAPNVFVGKIVPVLVFLSFLETLGTVGALLAALAWSLGVVAHKVARGERVPGLVLLSTVGLVAKTVAALATGSLVVYFLQPTLSTFLVGAAFLVSVPLGKPLAERLALDFCPFEPETANHPAMREFFTRLSLLWAVTSMINGSLTLWLLLTQSATTFVVVKSFTGPAFTSATIAIAVLWFRRDLQRDGIRLHFR